jgi:hypothetical protein
MRGVLTLMTVTALAAFILGMEASATPGSSTTQAQLRITFCGQIRNGPANDWSIPRAAAAQLGLPARFRGRTWTVYVRGAPCAFAMRNTRVLLRLWTRTRPGTLMRTGDPGLRGWICAKERTPTGGKGSPGGSCLYLGVGQRFHFVQLGSLTLAQVKRLSADRKLPIG